MPNHITSIGGTSETLAAVGASGSKRCCQTQAPHAKGYDAKLISCTHTDKSYQQISVTVCNVDFVILVLCLFLLHGSEGGRGLWHFVRQQYAGPSLHKSRRTGKGHSVATHLRYLFQSHHAAYINLGSNHVGESSCRSLAPTAQPTQHLHMDDVVL